MPLYVRLVRLTEQAVRNASNVGEMFAEARKIIEAHGGKVVDAYATLGAYDVVAVMEAPDDATAMKISAKIAATGNARAETLSAIPMTQFVESMK